MTVACVIFDCDGTSVSDGEETCDGDPVAVAQRLKNSQTGLVINVIGFDVGQYRSAAVKGDRPGCLRSVFSAKDRTELQEVWQQNTIDLNRYKIGNVNNQNQIFLSSTNAGNKLFLCVTNKLNKEKLQVTKALNLLHLRRDPNAQHIDYVQQKIAQKSEQVETRLGRFPKNGVILLSANLLCRHHHLQNFFNRLSLT